MEVQRPNAQAKGFLSKEMHEKCNFSSLLNSELPFQTPVSFVTAFLKYASNVHIQQGHFSYPFDRDDFKSANGDPGCMLVCVNHSLHDLEIH